MSIPAHRLFQLLRPLIILGLLFVGLIMFIYWFYNYSNLSPKNYAREVASPIEQSLIKAGAVRKCENTDNGRGWDNRRPWYTVQYKIRGNSSDEVAALIKDVLKQAGYNLVVSDGPPNPRDNSFYKDETRESPFTDLEKGTVDISVTIFGSADSNEQPSFCGVAEQDAPPAGYRIVSIGVDLPAYRR